jgi:hypothetical protein
VTRSNSIVLLVTAIVLSGCSSAASLLGGGSTATAPAQVRVPVGNELALPPDLSLRAPTQTVDGYQSNGQVASLSEDPIAAPARPAPVQQNVYGAPEAQDNYAKYGISKTNPDGTPKPKDQLQEELRAAILAEKRRKNPNYGTIFNIGEIFSDG